MEESALIQSIRAKVSKDIVGYHSHFGDDTIIVKRDGIVEIMKLLKEQFQFEMLVDMTAVDYLGKQDVRFEVVYHLNSLENNVRFGSKFQ